MIVSFPLITLLKQSYPDAQIVYITGRSMAELAALARDIDEVYVVEYAKKYLNWKQIKGLRSLNLDVIIHLRADRYLMCWAKLAKIPMRIATGHRFYSYWFCNRWVGGGRSRSLAHEAMHDIHLAKPLHIQKPPLTALPDLIEAQFKTIAKKNASSSKINFLIHPGAISAKERNWGVKEYAQFINALQPYQDCLRIVLNGTGEENVKCQQIQAACQLPVTLTGGLSIKELVKLLAQTDIVLAASTGPLHVAAALNKRCIGLYPVNTLNGVTRWGAIGKHAWSVSGERGCHGCLNGGPCQCVLNISPLTVATIVVKWLVGKEIGAEDFESPLRGWNCLTSHH